MTHGGSIVERGGIALRQLTPDDAPLLLSLRREGRNAALLEGLLDVDELARGFLEALKLDLWALPMVATRDGRPCGVLLNTETDLQSLNCRLVALFSRPERSRLPLALYLRHLFWSLPLHRVYARVPAPLEDCERLYESLGFACEGSLAAHQLHAGRLVDVRLLGLLRRDFDAWCEEREPWLALRREPG